MSNVVVRLTRRWPEAVEERLRGQCQLVLDDADRPMSRGELVTALQACDVLAATVTDRLDAELLSTPDRRCRLIANFGVGFNHIALDAARKADIRVTNTPGVLTDATADIAMALILSVARRTGEGERLLRSGGWAGWSPTSLLGTQVSGKTLGIVGMGRIGQATARRAAFGFGMKILYHSRTRLSPVEEAVFGATCVPDLGKLLAEADFVSLHCPASPATRQLLNRETLGYMRPHAFVINTARGDVIDEEALADAVRSRRIAGAGLDVYELEPSVHPGLMGLENVVLLPHQGSGSRETREAMGHCAADNIEAFIRGEPLPNPVN